MCVVAGEPAIRQRRGCEHDTGNQVLGVNPGLQLLSPESMTDVVLTAARLHATHWQDPSLLDEALLKASDWFQGRGQGSWQLAIQAGRDAWARAGGMLPAGTNTAPLAREATIATGQGDSSSCVASSGSSTLKPTTGVNWSPKFVSIIVTSFATTLLVVLHSGRHGRSGCTTLGRRGEVDLSAVSPRGHEAASQGSALQYFHDQLLAFIEDHGEYKCYLGPVVRRCPRT